MVVFQCKYCSYTTHWIFCIGHHNSRHQGDGSYTDCTKPLVFNECSKSTFKSQYTQIDRCKCEEYQENIGESEYWEKNNSKRSKLDTISKQHPASMQVSSTCIKWYKCPQCPFRTKKKFNLREHIIHKHTDPSTIQWLECKLCSYRCKRKWNLQKHSQQKHNSTEWFVCKMCPYESRTLRIMKRHVADTHTCIEWYKCPECLYMSKKKTTLKRHIINEHTDPSIIQWYKCKLCSYRRKRRYEIRRHSQQKHDTEWCVCKMCPYKSSTPGILRRHVVNTHIKWHVCAVCSYEGKSNEDLMQHIDQLHTDERNRARSKSANAEYFKCEICSCYSRDLKQHISVDHPDHISGIKHQECDVFTVEVKSPENMQHAPQLHSNEHNGTPSKSANAEYKKCEICLGYSQNLKRHTLINHPDHISVSGIKQHASQVCEIREKSSGDAGKLQTDRNDRRNSKSGIEQHVSQVRTVRAKSSGDAGKLQNEGDHRRDSTSDQAENYKCQICFCYTDNLKQHISAYHFDRVAPIHRPYFMTCIQKDSSGP